MYAFLVVITMLLLVGMPLGAFGQQPSGDATTEEELLQVLRDEYGDASFTRQRAQAEIPPPTGEPTAVPRIIQEQVDEAAASRGQCLDKYRLDRVHFDFTDFSQGKTLQAGDSLRAQGAVVNDHPFPLAAGRILAAVRYEDPDMAERNWHPLVEETQLSGTYPVAADGRTSFTFNWPIPEDAPAGNYQVEFFYTAGGKYSMSGLSFVPNFPGGAIHFTVANDRSDGRALLFDRRSVTLQGEPFELRTVPGPISPDTEAISVQTVLTSRSSEPVTADIDVKLHPWSHTDGSQPVVSETRTVEVSSERPATIPFRWDSVQPGVHELVIQATPQDNRGLPSRIKVRLPVTGNVPRVLFSGITGFEGDDAIITTCATNATFGDGSGSLASTVLTDNSEAASVSDAIVASELKTIQTRVPIAFLRDTLEITTVARDQDGTITDEHTFGYDKSILAEEIQNARWVRFSYIALAMGVILVAAWVSYRLISHFKSTISLNKEAI